MAAQPSSQREFRLSRSGERGGARQKGGPQIPRQPGAGFIAVVSLVSPFSSSSSLLTALCLSVLQSQTPRLPDCKSPYSVFDLDLAPPVVMGARIHL